MHPVVTSVKSDECNNPVNSDSHYGQWGQCLEPMVTQYFGKSTNITSIFGLIPKIISYLDRFYHMLFNQILFEVNFEENYL